MWFLKVSGNEKNVKGSKWNILIDSFSKAGVTKNQKPDFWFESKNSKNNSNYLYKIIKIKVKFIVILEQFEGTNFKSLQLCEPTYLKDDFGIGKIWNYLL